MGADSTVDPRVRALTPQDGEEFRNLRLRALGEHPEAFATSVAEEASRSPQETALRLASAARRVTYGAYVEEGLVGFATVVGGDREKQRHRATLSGMYVAPEARGRGIGRALLERVVATAREWEVTHIGVSVTVGNSEARRLYRAAGFVTYGIEPAALRVRGAEVDVELMSLDLGRP